MKIQPINYVQPNYVLSPNSKKVNFKGESLKAYDAVRGQACSYVEKAKEDLTRHIAELSRRGDYQGVINGKKTLIDIIRTDGRPKEAQEHDIYMLKQGIKDYIDKL